MLSHLSTFVRIEEDLDVRGSDVSRNINLKIGYVKITKGFGEKFQPRGSRAQDEGIQYQQMGWQVY